MKRLILAFLATLVLACGPVAPVVIEPVVRVDYVEAIRPIQVKTDQLDEHALAKLVTAKWQIKMQGFSNVCTAGHVGNQVWITAGHCLVNIGPEGRFIEGQPIHPFWIDVARDLAIFTVEGVPMKAQLSFSDEPVDFGTKLIVAGHPFGYDPIFVTMGTVANPGAFLDDKIYITFNVAGAPGNSGSPVLNEDGEIVSVLQIGWGQSFSPVTGGASMESMKELRTWLNFRTRLAGQH